MTSYFPEPSENLGLVIPFREIVRGKTFSHHIPSGIKDVFQGTDLGESFAYRSDDGLEWIITLIDPDIVEFVNRWTAGSRSFRVRKNQLP